MSKVTTAAGARLIRAGRVVAFPTETVYGLGADALDARAVRRIFRAKGRPSDNPLIVHVATQAMVSLVARDVPPLARKLMRAFWPGPLTIVLPKRDAVPSTVTAGLDTVGVRMPDHPIALALIKAARVPIAAPSANRSGKPSPTTAAHVRKDLPRVPVIDGGACRHGVESTVVDCTGARPRVLRLGAISVERLRAIIPGITVAKGTAHRPASPGMKHRHYAPSIPLRLFTTSAAAARHLRAHPRERALAIPRDATKAARVLYHALRHPPKGATALVAVLFPEKGVGRAINDRLRRAAQR